ncbi:MAG: UDP-N-acetylmuramate dehydrogenase [Clostridia bacterium]|nr:UDP-N-acetylmuramate dehydrogenase [Clostridia bacterium]
MELIEKIKAITNEKNIYMNEPMSKHTTFKTGGPADIFVVPETKQEILELLKLDIPKTIIGNGSNLLVKDGGIRGIVIKIATNNYEVKDNIIIADAGTMIAKLSNVAYQNELSGLEFACGIPGTLGGALVMNAGAYGGEIGNIVIETQVADDVGNILTIKNHEFGYRSSIFQRKNYVILEAKLRLIHGDKEQIRMQMDSNIQARKLKQPIDKPSAGSTFKRPKDNFAAKLIQDAGLKGFSIGDAMVSDLHSGFVVNKGNATSKEILTLIKYVQDKVNAEYGVMLEPEIRIIGEE